MSMKKRRNQKRNDLKNTIRRWRVSLESQYGILWKEKSLRITTEVPEIESIIAPLVYSVREYIKLEKPFFLDANPIAEGVEAYVGQLVHPDIGVIAVTDTVSATEERALFTIVTALPTIPAITGIYHRYNKSIAAMYEKKRQIAEAKQKAEAEGGQVDGSF